MLEYKVIEAWMDGWMDGWMNGWMDGCVGGWLDGWMDGWIDGWMALLRRKGGRDGRMDVCSTSRSCMPPSHYKN